MALTFHPLGHWLAVGRYDGSVGLYDAATFEEVAEPPSFHRIEPFDCDYGGTGVMKHIVKSFFRYGLVLCVLMPAYSMAKGPTVSPDITRAAPRGTRQGSTVTVIVQGRNLADAQVVLFSDPGLQGRVLGVRRLSQKKREEPKLGDTGAAVYEAPPYEVTLEVSVSPGARAGHSYLCPRHAPWE